MSASRRDWLSQAFTVAVPVQPPDVPSIYEPNVAQRAETHRLPSNSKNRLLSNILGIAFADPATPKIITLLTSCLLLFVFDPNINNNYDKIPFVVVIIISFIYSIVSLYLEVSKSQNDFAKNQILKTIFKGRVLQWHEIHCTCTIALTAANFSIVIYGFRSSLPVPICIFTNIVVFGFEWYQANKHNQNFKIDLREPQYRCRLTKWILTFFHRFPKLFNIIRLGCILMAFLVVITIVKSSKAYYLLGLALIVITSTVLLVIQSMQKTKCQDPILKSKMHTYLSVIISTLIGLMLLSLNFRTFDHRSDVFYDDNDDDFFHTSNLIIATTPRYWSNHFSVESPITYALIWLTFIISLLDLYSQAIFHQSIDGHQLA